MRTTSLVFSLLFLALFDFSQCQFVLTGAAGAVAATALAGAALAGAGVLGAATLGALAGRGRRGGRKRSFRRRGRRSVEELQQEETVWADVAAVDGSMCAQKLVCLLEAEQEKLDDDEQLLVAFVGDVEGSPAEQEVFSKLPYEAAGWLGKYQGAAACESYFGERCGYDRHQMMSFITSLWDQAEKAEEAEQTTTTTTSTTTTEATKTA